MKKIIFLDFDGVISTNRAWLAQKHIDDFYLRWIDPLAVEMIYDLVVKFDYQIVVTSTWRKFGRDNCALALGKLAAHLHADWCTGDMWAMGESSVGSRPREIDDWLRRNTNMTTEYIILDDDSFQWTTDQLHRWVKTDQLNGFSTENYETVLNVNDHKDVTTCFAN